MSLIALLVVCLGHTNNVVISNDTHVLSGLSDMIVRGSKGHLSLEKECCAEKRNHQKDVKTQDSMFFAYNLPTELTVVQRSNFKRIFCFR